MVKHVLCKHDIVGSSPIGSSTLELIDMAFNSQEFPGICTLFNHEIELLKDTKLIFPYLVTTYIGSQIDSYVLLTGVDYRNAICSPFYSVHAVRSRLTGEYKVYVFHTEHQLRNFIPSPTENSSVFGQSIQYLIYEKIDQAKEIKRSLTNNNNLNIDV